MAKEKKEKPKKEPKAKKAPKAKKEPKAKKPPKGKKGKGAQPEAASPRPAARLAPRPAAAGLQPDAQAAGQTQAPKKKSKAFVLILLAAAVAAACYFIIPTIKKGHQYDAAVLLIEKGSYETARASLKELGDYKDARILGTYALARELYNNGRVTSGTALEQVAICLDSIPASYDGELAEQITKFKNQFGYYRARQDRYNAQTAYLHETGLSSLGGGVSHNSNFYTAFWAFYENAAHFWDEPAA